MSLLICIQTLPDRAVSAFLTLHGPGLIIDFRSCCNPDAIQLHVAILNGTSNPNRHASGCDRAAATTRSAARRAPDMFLEDGPNSSSASGPET